MVYNTSKVSEKEAGAGSQLRILFSQAVALPAESREAFQDQHCGADLKLRARLEQLLSYGEGSAHDLLRDAIEQAELVRHGIAKEDVQQAVQDAIDMEGLEALALPEIENFTIEAVLGGGGMGIVYRAQQHGPLSRPVAVKVMKPGLDSVQFLRRFRVEQAALAAMHHPSIVGVLEAGLTQSGHPFFAMELIEGQPVDAFCESRDLKWQEILPLISETCRAIDHAHKKGIIHRDLKPSNVMVAIVDDKPVIRVIDFGIAKALSSETAADTHFSLVAHFIGTPHYVSPEQMALDSAQLGPRSDVYSLGVLLYKILCGSTPLENHEEYRAAREGQQKLSVARLRLLLADIPQEFPSRMRPEWRMPREIDWILQKALAFDAAERYESAGELASDIDRLLAGERVKAHPPSRIYRVRKWLAKHEQLSRALLLMIAGVILGSLLMFVSDLSGSLKSNPQQETTRITTTRNSMDTAENTVSADLMEAAVLTQMLSSIEMGRFDQLQRYQLPTDADGNFLVSPVADDLSPAEKYGFRKFLTSLASPEPLRAFKHPGTVWRMAVSPDGLQLATACEDALVRVWDLQTGEERKQYGPVSWQATAVAYSPDGLFLAAGDRDGHVTIWNTATDQEVARTQELDGGVESLVWSPDGKTLAAGIRYQFVLLLNRFGQPLSQLSQPGRFPPRYETIRFSPNSSRLYAPNAGGSITVWDLNTYQPSGELLAEQGAMQHAFFALDDSGRRWLVGTQEQDRLEVVTGKAGDEPLDYISVESFPVSMAGCPDGKHIAAVTRNGLLVLCRSVNVDWSNVDAETWMIEAGPERVTDVVWISDQVLATASTMGGVKLWTIDRLRRLRRYDAKLADIYLVTPEILALQEKVDSDSSQEQPTQDGRLYKLRDMHVSAGFGEPLAITPKLVNPWLSSIRPNWSNVGVTQFFALFHPDHIGFYDTASGEKVASFAYAKLEPAFPDLRIDRLEFKGAAWSRDATQYAWLLGDQTRSANENQSNHLFSVGLQSTASGTTLSTVRHWFLPPCRGPIQFVGETNELAVCVQNARGERELRFYDLRRNSHEVVWSSQQWVDDFCISRDGRYVGLKDFQNRLLDRNTGELFDLEYLSRGYMRFADAERLLLVVGPGSLVLFHVPSRRHLGRFRLQHLDSAEPGTLKAIAFQERLLPIAQWPIDLQRVLTFGQ